MTLRVRPFVVGGCAAHLLKQSSMRRTVVFVNDFRTVNLDASLIKNRCGDTIELSNGCICCQIGDRLTDALIALINSEPRPKALIIEASGVSDPWRIAQVGRSDPALRLAGIFVLIDTANALAQLADPLLTDTLERQWKAADFLILNHVDQISPSTLMELHRVLDRRVPRTPRIETSFAEIPDLVWQEPHDLSALHVIMPFLTAKSHRPATVFDEPPKHGQTFMTWHLPNDELYRAQDLRALLRDMPEGVIRMKGLIRTDQYRLAVLQYFGRHGTLENAEVSPHILSTSRLVAIAPRATMDVVSLELAFETARISATLEHSP